MPVTEDTKPNDNLGGFTNYKQKYSSMKTQLKAILYENELFQDEIRKLQRELLDIYRDKEILLERVIQYEDIDSSDSDSGSQSSDNECNRLELIKQEPQVFVPTSEHCNNQTFVVSNKTDAVPANGGGSSNNGSAATKSTSTGKPTAASKPKAPSRSRSKTNATKSGSKVTSSAKSNGKNQKQQAVKPNNSNNNNNNDQKQQQQPLTIISGVPISSGQINLVPQITPIETTMGTTLIPSIQQTLTPQANHNMSDQFQQQHQIIQHHQMHLQQPLRHHDAQATIGVDSSQQQQQIMTSQWQNQQDLNQQNNTFSSNGNKIGNFVIKTDIQPINGGSNGNSVTKNAPTGKTTAASKPKAPSRNRSKTNADKNGSKTTTNSGTKSNNGKNQKQAVKANGNNNNGNNNNNNNQLQMQHQQALTVISRIPITSGQINIVPQIAPIETTMGNKLMPSIQSITTQANHNMSEQFQQQQHQIIQHHQMHHQQSHHHLSDPQAVVGSPQQLQQSIITTQWQNQQDLNQQNNAFSTQHLQPIESTMSNNLVPSIQNLTNQPNHTISEHFQQQQQQHHHQLQMIQHHQMMQQQQLDQQQQQQQLEQQQQQQQLEQQQQQQQLEQQQQLQHHIGDPQASVAMGIDNSQQLQQPIITTQWQNQQDLNQQTNTFSTQHLTTEQLSAEELEQHLESRRLEQAALLLPDWESSVPSEIFSTDSAIKFMAED